MPFSVAMEKIAKADKHFRRQEWETADHTRGREKEVYFFTLGSTSARIHLQSRAVNVVTFCRKELTGQLMRTEFPYIIGHEVSCEENTP